MDSRLNRLFRLIIFDWDGTAVESRTADATAVRRRLESLLKLGVRIVVITGTNFDNIDRQLSSAIYGPHKQLLYICPNRGSEVYGFDAQGKSTLLHSRVASPQENRLLTEVADRVRDLLEARIGLPIHVIYNRLNRRKIDLIPLPEWSDPPKEKIGELLKAVQQRLKGAGLAGGLGEAFEITQEVATDIGLQNGRITSDVKHIEVGLTDKGDSVAWVIGNLAAKEGIAPRDILIAGDEFGPIGGFEGSDHRMVIDAARDATFVSVGVEPNGVPPEVISLGGGPPRFIELLDQQIALPQTTVEDGFTSTLSPSVFIPTADPLWLLVEEGFSPAREHELESLFTVANGYTGTRGSLAEISLYSRPATFIAGVFDNSDRDFHLPELVVAPIWTKVEVSVGNAGMSMEHGATMVHHRTLDFRRGVLLREWRYSDGVGHVTHITYLRFASLADRRLLVQALSITPQNYTERVVIEDMIDGRVWNFGDVEHLVVTVPTDSLLVARTMNSGITLAMSMANRLRVPHPLQPRKTSRIGEKLIADRWEWEAHIGDNYQIERLVVAATSRDALDPAATASTHLGQLILTKLEDLVSAHERAWAQRWNSADIEIRGDSEAQQSVRFALYHLIGAANPDDDRVSIGARGLTGEAYNGHVFWDTEIYMLPFFVFTHPPSARALLMYRYHTLPAARDRAKGFGYRGALYAWESALTGEDVTMPFVLTPTGELIPIHSRLQEHHISADIAYGIWQYWRSTGDDSFLLEAGAEMLLEIARFWASRVSLEQDGRYHIRHVIGPDEYHEDVDDNAYTNTMAQWTLERAVEAVGILKNRWPDRWKDLSSQIALGTDEAEGWDSIARGLVTGYDPTTGLIEQFAGYFNLDDIDLAAYESRTAPIDIILGRERIRQTQAIKQADVMLLIFLLWDRFPAKVREVNYRYYEPRTGHGSSLSPSIYAAVAARLGDLSSAGKYFEMSAEVDLADNMGNAAEGLHIGAMGGLYQATICGFAGMCLREDGLTFNPHIPVQWEEVRFPIRWRERLLRITISGTPPTIECVLESGEPMVVAVGEGKGQTIEKERRFQARLDGQTWSSWEEKSL